MSFQDLWNKFSFIFGRLCDEKTCAFVVMGLEKRLCKMEVRWADVIGQTVSFLSVCVCVCGGRVG